MMNYRIQIEKWERTLTLTRLGVSVRARVCVNRNNQFRPFNHLNHIWSVYGPHMIQFRFSNWSEIFIIINRKFRNINLISTLSFIVWLDKNAVALGFPRSENKIRKSNYRRLSWKLVMLCFFPWWNDGGNAVVGLNTWLQWTRALPIKNDNYNYKLWLLYAIKWNIIHLTVNGISTFPKHWHFVCLVVQIINYCLIGSNRKHNFVSLNHFSGTMRISSRKIEWHLWDKLKCNEWSNEVIKWPLLRDSSEL